MVDNKVEFIILSLKDKFVSPEILITVDTKFWKALSENVFEILAQSPALNFDLLLFTPKVFNINIRSYIFLLVFILLWNILLYFQTISPDLSK